MRTTKDQYCRDGEYLPERAELHRKIIEDLLDQKDSTENKPDVMMMGGGTAAGKSTITKMLLEAYREEGEDVVVIDADELKKLLPEYGRLVTEDPHHMAELLHDESSDLATMLYEAAIERKLNVIFDGTMKNAEKYSRFIDLAKSKGYTVSAFIADVPLDIAMKRAEIRFQIERRRVPEETIRESHKMVPATFRALEHKFDSFYLYDTSTKHTTQFYVKRNGRILAKMKNG